MKNRLGEGFIFLNGCRDIEFLVDGDKILHGHIAYLAKGEFMYEGVSRKTTYKITEDGKYIQFFVHYITDVGTQAAKIPYTPKNLKLFKQITTSHNGSFIVFRTEQTNPLINGIGTKWYSNHKTKEYGSRWLFWDPEW
jgi:hypothetical protein